MISLASILALGQLLKMKPFNFILGVEISLEPGEAKRQVVFLCIYHCPLGQALYREMDVALECGVHVILTALFENITSLGWIKSLLT